MITVISSLFIGGLISLFITHYYSKKTLKIKNLSCFVQYLSEILTDIEPEVKNNLAINFKGQKVESLYQVQLVIANTGDIPIQNLIKPLVLEIPNNGLILDANLLHIDPKGREVNIDVANSKKTITFNFPLLNSGDYFITKLLVKGEPPSPKIDQEDHSLSLIEYLGYNLFNFSITTEDLPPSITSQHLPSDYLENRFHIFDKSAILIGALFIGIALIYSYILNQIGILDSLLTFQNSIEFKSSSTFLNLSIIIAWIISLLFLFIGIVIPLSEIKGLRPKKKTKFKISRNHSKLY